MRTSSVFEHGDRVRVLVVDDSVVVRRAITLAIETDPQLEVVGIASSGELALQKVDQLNPDVVTLDVEMPGMNGLETLTELRKRRPTLRIVMVSNLTQGGAAVTIEALSRGADDCASKSSGGHSIEESVALLRDQLCPKLKQFFRFKTKAADTPSPTSPSPNLLSPPLSRPLPTADISAIVLGISTGGPTALAELVPALGKDLHVPLLIVQHMPPMFTRLLAERLDSKSSMSVVEAVHGMAVEPGKVYIAPGDFHMRVCRASNRVEIALDQAPQENCCRPAVDVLFRSAAEVWGKHSAAVVMTGMGKDGLAGARSLWAAGAPILAQDEDTSVVWGMPGEIVRAKLADQVLPLADISGALIALARGSRL